MPLGLEEADRAEKGAIRAAVTKRSRDEDEGEE